MKLESGAQAGKLGSDACVCNAAMHLGLVVESCAAADRFARRSFEVNTEEGKVAQGDKDSKLEVRGGHPESTFGRWAHWSCGVFFERVHA